jgi:hypothetical protein
VAKFLARKHCFGNLKGKARGNKAWKEVASTHPGLIVLEALLGAGRVHAFHPQAESRTRNLVAALRSACE